jgi:hypothetical protein
MTISRSVSVRFLFILAAALLPLAALAGDALAKPLAPGTVLTLPLVDSTPESANMLGARSAVIMHRLQFEFLSREWKGLKSPGEPGMGAEAMDRLAASAKADWVVAINFLKANADTDAGGGFIVTTELHVRVRDARNHRWLKDEPVSGQSTGTGSPVMIFMRSIDETTRAAIAPLLLSYPQSVALPDEDSLVDYLDNPPKR